MTAKQIRFVKATALDETRHVAEVACFDQDGTPLDPPGAGAATGNATTETPGLVKQAAHVDPSSGQASDVINALIAAGIMAAS